LLLAGDNGYMTFPPNKFLTEELVTNAISRIVYRGETSNMANGLSLATEILTEEGYGIPANIPKMILLIVAGPPNDADLTSAEADRIKALNIRIVTVGIGTKVSRNIFCFQYICIKML